MIFIKDVKFYLIEKKMMLSLLLLSMVMILLSTLVVIRLLIRGNSQSWFINLNLTYKTPCAGLEKGLLVSVLAKLNLLLFMTQTIVVLCI